MSDNIQVAIRIRPLNSKEVHESQGKKCLNVNKANKSISISINSNTKNFSFDYIGDEDTSQDEIFESIGKPIVNSCLCGYNGSIFAYGQTGAGKTYTIMGPPDASLPLQFRGILPRCLEFLFSSIKKELKKNLDLEYLIKCSFLEIYNEQINDMISPDQRNLLIREDIKKGAYVENLQQETITSFDEALEIIEKGIKYRHIGSTSMNKESSRSHSVFTLQIESKEKREDLWNFKNSYFHLIDLAGSERQKLTEAFGDRLKEAGMINKSLSSLGNVVSSLVEISEGRSRHVPYRDSKLTFLLKDSIGGNSKTCIIANISPSYFSYGETLSTLRFAERAKLVKNKAIINEDTMGTISELRTEVKRLKSLLKNQQENFPTENPANFNDRIKGVEALLEQNLRIRLQSESSLGQEIEERENYINSLVSALEKCEKKIKSDKKTIKNKDEALKKLQKSEKTIENNLIEELKEEIERLRRENENNPVEAKLSAENNNLKSKIAFLENELKESSSSMTSRLKLNQDFTEKLQIALRKSANEREQLHILLQEYSKKFKRDDTGLALELQTAKKQIKELRNLLSQEKDKVSVLEEQISVINESQLIEDFNNSSRESKLSTLNSSGLISIPESERNQEIYQKILEENNKLHKQSEENSLKLLESKEINNELLIQIKDLATQVKNLKKIEEINFILEEEVEKLKEEIIQKEDRIECLQSESETILAENEFLSTQLIDFSQQITSKEKKITELTDKLSSRLNKDQLEENMKLKSELDDLKQQSSLNTIEFSQIKEDLNLSVISREDLLQELKRLQTDEISIKNECHDLKTQLAYIEHENESLKDQIDELNNNIVQISGHNNLNQKIKLHAKMKEENNKLKEQNYQIREELRRKDEKIEVLNKKYEIALKGHGIEDFNQFDSTDKIEVLEKELKSSQETIEEITNTIYSLPYIDEIPGTTIQEKLLGAFGYLSQELDLRKSKIDEQEADLSRKDTRIKILEGEHLVFKQKLSLKT